MKGYYVAFVGFIFCVTETALFGWHMFPQSSSEAYADFVGLAIVVAGIFYEVGRVSQ
jgi:hypothetical protein